MTSKLNSKPDLNGIAYRLKNLIKIKGIDQNELARQLDITAATLSKIFNAKALPSTETLIRMAKYFDVSIDYILKGEEDLTSELLYRHQEISKEIENRIKDVQEKYQTTEINEMIQELPNKSKKTSLLDLLKIAIQIQKGADEETIKNLFHQVDSETYDLLKRLNTEFIESHQKK